MSNYEQLKADIAAVVRANGIEAITGDRLQQVLTHMVDVLGNDYALAGVATPTTNPPTPDGDTAYIAGTSGTYTYFLDSNYNPLVVPSNCLTALLVYDASAEAWTAHPFGTIAQGTIGTNELADGAVTTPKIADSAVTSSKIGANAVTNAKINNGAVSEQKLATAVQNKINDAVTLSTAQTITGDKEFTQPIQALELYGDGDLSVHALDDLTLQSHNGDVEIAADDDINLNGARVFVNTELNVDAGLEVGTDTGGVNSIKATGKILTNGQEVATKAYTDAELATKQDAIADLDTIRAGAALGATAYQKPSDGIPESDLSASVQTSLENADNSVQIGNDVNFDFSVSDENGSKIIASKDGHIITKKFNSANAYQKPSGGIPESDLSASVQTSLGNADTAAQIANEDNFDLSIADENENKIVASRNGHIITKNFNSEHLAFAQHFIDRYKGKIISILGDSISTYGVPSSTNTQGTYTYVGNLCRYSEDGNDSILFEVNDTYWMRLINKCGMTLGVNESWRGTTISSARANPLSSQTRIGHLGLNGTPDLILVYGGANDAGDSVTLGTFDTSAPPTTAAGIAALPNATFADAVRAMFCRIMYTYPRAEVVCILPTFTSTYYTITALDDYVEKLREACDFFGIKYIDARTSGVNYYNKSYFLVDGIHPNAEGMKKLFEKVYEQLIFG